MATHSSVLAWRIPGTAGPGGLPSMGSHRVRHDLSADSQCPHLPGTWTEGINHSSLEFSGLYGIANEDRSLQVATVVAGSFYHPHSR